MKLLLSILFFLFLFIGQAQNTITESIEKYNSDSVTYIHVKDVQNTENIVLLDTRKKQEYDISHIKNAIWVGHEAFKQDYVSSKFPDKNVPIIVYCSIGVRSEDIGEKLKKAGYTNVKNLYGGIFDWKNQKRSIYNNKGIKTDSIHAFSKQWGKLLTNGIKVYDLKQNIE